LFWIINSKRFSLWWLLCLSLCTCIWPSIQLTLQSKQLPFCVWRMNFALSFIAHFELCIRKQAHIWLLNFNLHAQNRVQEVKEINWKVDILSQFYSNFFFFSFLIFYLRKLPISFYLYWQSAHINCLSFSMSSKSTYENSHQQH
jgi:hypothetical protein